MEDEKQSLLSQQRTGDALSELQNHHGWKELVAILSSYYKENVKLLIFADSVETRANLKAIEMLAAQIELKIDFGKAAADELKEDKFKNMQATPE